MPGPRAVKSENGFFRCDTWLQIFQNDSKICEAEVTVTPLINKICNPCIYIYHSLKAVIPIDLDTPRAWYLGVKILKLFLHGWDHRMLSFLMFYKRMCSVSCCWPKFQTIFNPCNPLQQTTLSNLNSKIVLNNKTGPLFLEFNWYQRSFRFLKR